ncbi:hypothetical protein EXIGLDRAFT_723646 [Exidia glandulosa HHB12029]|uniref:Secreted protein n=1 Tax=Exidia glandulosa HHB12029 TaxID=1314781 RepID=A0A165EQQ7_EXIGL|nr:hypothetical protein EXIGLDRAFT_723646 [Exidia glandulosa HHB12029]
MTTAIHIILFFCALLLAMCGVLAVAPFVWGRTPVVDEEKALVETDVDEDDEPADLRRDSPQDVNSINHAICNARRTRARSMSVCRESLCSGTVQTVARNACRDIMPRIIRVDCTI